jgi:hypothetical protein
VWNVDTSAEFPGLLWLLEEGYVKSGVNPEDRDEDPEGAASSAGHPGIL